VSRISVLTYHSIDRSRSVLSVSPEEFQEHVEQVARSERPVLAPSRLAWPLGEEPGFSGDGFAFTFDDGYASVAEHAAPLLARHGFPYGVFLVTSRIGSTNQWPGQAAWVAPAPLLDWDAVGKLIASGAEIGAHTSGHADLSRANESAAREEIEASRDEIERRLGSSPQIFAYPGGRSNAAVRRVAGSLFAACFGTRHARMRDGDDRSDLPRIETLYFRRPESFRRLFSPGIDARLAARRALRAVRRLR